jgi:hypothetical protein
MKKTGLMALILGGLTLAGCGGYVGYYASVPPPPVRVEAFGVAPGPGFVWVSGYYGYNGGRYAWVPGTWRRPPRGRVAWEAGRWENHGGRYRYAPGRWR